MRIKMSSQTFNNYVNKSFSRDQLQQILDKLQNDVYCSNYLVFMGINNGVYKKIVEDPNTNVNKEKLFLRTNSVLTPLQVSCMCGNFQKFKILLSSPKIEIPVSVLQYICNLDLRQFFNYIFHHPKLNINNQNEQGMTILHLCCEIDNLQYAAKFISDPRTDLSIVNNRKETVLHTACRIGNQGDQNSIIKLLVKSPKINVNAVNEYYDTALHILCRLNNEPCVKILLDTGRVDPNIQNFSGKYPDQITYLSKIKKMIQDYRQTHS